MGRDEPVAAQHAPVLYEVVAAGGALGLDRSLERIYLGGVLERLEPAGAVRLLQRCRRAMAPGGRLRVASDDLDAVLDRVTSRETWQRSGLAEDGFDWAASRFHLLNHAFRQRAWFYNETEMRRLATMVGFRGGRRVEAGADPRFRAERLRNQPLVMEFDRPVRQDGAQPSVDILIPLYRPDHLKHALESALEQTWEPITIVICDDGPGDASRAIIDEFRHHRAHSHVQYFRNQPPTGNTARNAVRCLQRSSGTYVKFLFDDDVLEPRCVEKMACCLRDDPDVTLVTSHRRLIDAAGQALPEIEATRRPVADDSRVNGSWLIDEMLRNQQNFIGEPSTVLFRRTDIQEIVPDFWALGSINFMGNADVTVWLSLLAQGDGIYLTESLSRFRMHADQTSNDPLVHELCRVAWHRAVRGATFLGLYDAATPPPLEATSLAHGPWWSREVRDAAEAAERALAKGDVAAALALSTRALELEPDDPRLTLLRARGLAAGGDAAGAIDVLIEGVRRNPGAAGPYLKAAEMASALGNREGARAVMEGAQARLRLLRPIMGVVERHGVMQVEPHAVFEVAPGVPPMIVTFELLCRSSAPMGDRPIRVVLAVEGVAVAAGELRGMGGTLALQADVPHRSSATRLDLWWNGAVDVVPSPTDDPLAVRLVKVDIVLA
jgi:glycosyltransferase involved in cell wall biosynthesis/predicted SAM-dependent methyltransferase